MKKLYLNLMLLVCMMSMGINAWGQDEYTSVYSRASVSEWTEADITDWGGNSNLVVNQTYGLGFNTTKPSAAYTATKTFSIEENSKIKYEIVWRTGNSTGRSSNFEFIQIGGNIRISYTSDYYYYLNTNGTSFIEAENANRIQYNKNTADNSIIIVFNTATKQVESFTFNNIDLSSKVTGTLDGNFNTVTFGLQRGGSTSNWEYPNYLTSIAVSECQQTVSISSYTINYLLNDDVIFTSSNTMAIGAMVSAEQSLTVDGVKYIVEADEAPSMTIVEGSNVLNVPVRLPYTATLNVTTTVNGESSTNTTNLTESDYHDVSWSYAYPLYVMGSDGLYYKADNTTEFGEGGTFTDGEVINKTVTYTNADADVVYFREATSNVGTNYAYSNGESGNVAAQNERDRGISVGTLPAGSYEFVVNITAANRRSLVIRQGQNDPLASVGTSDEDKTTGIKTAQFELTEETSNLFINGANSGDKKTNQSEDFDYVLIRKVASTVPVTISAAGYATFASDKALDLSNLPEGLTAYVATSLSSDAVTINPITTTVAPGTGLIFKGAQGKYIIPVASEGTEVTDNMLVGVVGEAVTLPQDGTCYVLALNAESKAVFQQVTTKAVASVPAGKAYLNTATTSPAPARPDDMPGFDGVTLAKTLNIYLPGEGEATAIKTVETAEQQDGAIYNLAGQRVGKDYKGIVIMNGKKYLVK